LLASQSRAAINRELVCPKLAINRTFRGRDKSDANDRAADIGRRTDSSHEDLQAASKQEPCAVLRCKSTNREINPEATLCTAISALKVAMQVAQIVLGPTMKEGSIERRLAAILAADVAGYSRLMSQDELATLRALKAHRRELVDPIVAKHHGRIVKTTGDGMLVEFASIVDAVSCAVSIQRGMIGRNEAVPDDKRIVFRIGINVGDIIFDGDDIFGDGVNIAARLEALCEPGGLCISRGINEQIRDKLALAFADLGEQTVKNIARSIGVFGLAPGDIAALPEKALPELPSEVSVAPAAMPEQQIHFCRSSDGVQIAYSCVGQGPPLVKTGNWMTHLEKDLESPIWRHLWRDLARDNTLIRYDARGNGLSDWEVDEISLDAFVRDLEAVVDAAGVEQFDLIGISQGCAASLAYAVRHPDRVNRLVLYGGYAIGFIKRARTAADREQIAAMLTLTRLGWGQQNPAFRQMFTSQFVPGATKEQEDWFNDLQRFSCSPEVAVRILEANGNTDVTDLLGKVSVPTLVMHAREDCRIPFESGRRMAAGIAGARFVALQSRNHLILEDEPAYPHFRDEIRSFLHG
jgi:class 3 adenylate cyclase/pimeloyl-ACP methyl ester carboxylesterase